MGLRKWNGCLQCGWCTDGHPLSATAMLQPTGISPSDAIPLSAAMLTGVGDPLAWQLIDEAFRFKPRPEYPEIGQYSVYTIAYPPKWRAYLKAKALEEGRELKPPVAITYKEEYFEVRKSPKGGRGALATADISEGTLIHVELPLINSREHGEALERSFLALSDADKEVFINLASHDDGPGETGLDRIFGPNCFKLGETQGVFKIACRFNHACSPQNNISWSWNDSMGRIEFKMTKAVKSGDELLISYGHKPWHLPRLYNFICDCGCNPDQPVGNERAEEKKEKLDPLTTKDEQKQKQEQWLAQNWRKDEKW